MAMQNGERLNTLSMLVLPERYHSVARQFIKFGITGAIGAVVDFTVLYLLHDFLGWQATIELYGSKLIAANMISVFLAIVSNFLINRYWTFRGHTGNAAQQWTGYFILNIFTWALNQILTSYFTFHFILLSPFGENRIYVAKALAIGLILFVNFAGSKFIVFRKKPVAPNVQ